MFTKKVQPDVKKSTQKFLDSKKDTSTRIKHLRIVLENTEKEELRSFYDTHYKLIYSLVCDGISAAETNLKQRDLTFHLVHKAAREELDQALAVLEQLLLNVPELLQKGWQQNSFFHTLTKLLNPANSIRLRKDAIRYFIIWYQILGENAPKEVNAVFSTIVPGFPSPCPGLGLPPASLGIPAHRAVFHDSNPSGFKAEVQPILPPQSGEKTVDDPSYFFLDILLNTIVSQVGRVEWREKLCASYKCLSFLLEKFKKFYLPHIFPEWNSATSLYPPVLDLPEICRKLASDETKDPFVSCRVCVIKWIISYTHINKRDSVPPRSSPATSITQQDAEQPGNLRCSVIDYQEESAAATLREVLYSSRENVNLVLEVYRQAFLLPFSHAVAIRRAIGAYKDWIQMNGPELPPFLMEPMEGDAVSEEARVRLRTDSYLGAVSRDHVYIRAGLQSTLQVFITHAANVFLVNTRNPMLLEEQVDTCKRVLNIYRFMVMQTKMELTTWEQLLLVLLRITSLVLSRTPPKRKDETLGEKLAPAIFQTLIVTWIKANLNVVISLALWDQFLAVLSSLTQWEELIREWAKTLETLTRVLARHVYNLDLTDLPLDRLSEQQTKKQRKGIRPTDGLQQSQKRVNYRMSSTSGNTPVPSQEAPSITSYASGHRSRTYSASANEQQQQPPTRCYSDGHLGRAHWRRSRRRDRHPRHTRRWRSLESVGMTGGDSPLPTRSPSPANSSGMECGGVKGLEFVAADAASLDSGDGRSFSYPSAELRDGRSVMAGGCVRGWMPDVAVVLWRRMLGALGDVNRLADPSLHAQVFEYLVKLWDTLYRIEENLRIDGEEGISPPLEIFAPWCFKALELPDSYQRGKLSAYRLICRMVSGISPHLLNKSFLDHAYRALHVALAGPSTLVICNVLKALGSRFLSRQLPGYSLLLLDLISAANLVLESSDVQTAPRMEAASILGSVLSLPYMVTQAPNLDPRDTSLAILNCTGAKDLVIASLIRATKREPQGTSRCTLLCGLAVFVYTELGCTSPHPSVPDALHLILLALKFRQRSVGLLACDLLFSLADHVAIILEKFPDLGARVILTVAHVIGSLGPNVGPLGAALAFVLGEWTMRMPLHLLLKGTPKSILLTVLTVLCDISSGSGATEAVTVDFSEELLREWENSVKCDDLKVPRNISQQQLERGSCLLACRAVLMHLVSHLGHFPLGLGAARLSSLVQEHDDVPELGNELSNKLFTVPNVQLLIVRNSLLSLIEIDQLYSPGGGVTADLITENRQSRILLRDLTNKASWDASQVYCSPQDLPAGRWGPRSSRVLTEVAPVGQQLMSLFMPGQAGIGGMLRRRPDGVLPDWENGAEDMDSLDDLLRYIGYSSRECLQNPETELSAPSPTPSYLNRQTESEVISAVLSQRTSENEYLLNSREPIKTCHPPEAGGHLSAFQHCRSLLSQLGLSGWDRRPQVHLLSRTEQLLRELRNLDRQRCRETHKVALIYVAAGQEDKISILSNKGGSQAYEQFVAALAWEVELATHTGFSGGLGSGCGDTALYYASAFIELLFHVATRMPSNTEEALLQKMRHLGNDEVHIVWSEHNRDYRRSALPTEFCDVLIVIYPLPDALFRVTIDTKTEMPLFGPLWSEVIVQAKALPGLIRATVVAASRAKRRTLPFYQAFYEERERSLSTVISSLKDPQCFEEFIAAVFSPASSNKESNDFRGSIDFNRIGDKLSPPVSNRWKQ